MNMNCSNIRTSASRQQGFTLIELMVVVVIVALITAIAIPSYRNHVIKANRAAAEGFMLQIANKEEQVVMDMRSYVAVANNAAFPAVPAAGGLGLAVPSDVATNYTISVALVAGPPPGYMITAVPTNPPQNDTLCQTLTLDATGAKGIAATAGTAPTGTVPVCWK